LHQNPVDHVSLPSKNPGPVGRAYPHMACFLSIKANLSVQKPQENLASPTAYGSRPRSGGNPSYDPGAKRYFQQKAGLHLDLLAIQLYSSDN
jgi:hypothetical protein